jgi:DNA repair protein RadC
MNNKISNAVKRLEKLLSEVDAPVYGSTISGPNIVKAMSRGLLFDKKDENFLVFYLTTTNQLIKSRIEFTGTIDGATVHSRNIVRSALELNAAAVIFAHNHPSGSIEPSTADKNITKRLVDALDLIDVRVLDHLIVGGTSKSVFSFNEAGLL